MKGCLHKMILKPSQHSPEILLPLCHQYGIVKKRKLKPILVTGVWERMDWVKNRIGVLLIHGAGLGSWIWRDVADALEVPCLMADFPLADGEDGDRTGLSLDDYVAAIRAQAEEWIAPRFVIVAHSVGGLIGLKLAGQMPERVAGFIGIGAIIPKNGRGSMLSSLPAPNRWVLSAILRKGNTRPPEKAIRSGLCNDLDEALADEVVRRFRPESVRLYTDKLAGSIPDVPKGYVRLAKDKELGAIQNRMIRHLAPQEVETLDTGHLPMLADPQALASAVSRFIESLPDKRSVS